MTYKKIGYHQALALVTKKRFFLSREIQETMGDIVGDRLSVETYVSWTQRSVLVVIYVPIWENYSQSINTVIHKSVDEYLVDAKETYELVRLIDQT